MKGEFCVNYDTLDNALETMTTAYTEFSSITDNNFNKEIDELKIMNSDFAEATIDMLEMIQRFGFEEIVSHMSTYIEQAKKTYEEIKTTDETLAKTVYGEK